MSNYPTLENCVLGAVKLTKHADVDQYKYSGYGIRFERKGFFSHPSRGDGKNLIIFGVDMRSSTKIDNRKKDILILGKGPTQELEHAHSAEKMYSIIFTKKKKFCSSLHYNGADSYLFVNGTEIIQFKVALRRIKMFKFIKQIFISTIMFFGSLSSVNSLESVSMINQECKVRPEIVNVNSSEPLFDPFSNKTSKCRGSCNNINDPNAKLCIPVVVKNLNIKVFNLMLRTNETRHKMA